MTRTQRHWAVATLILMAATACSPALAPRSVALDPSNPDGPESGAATAAPQAESTEGPTTYVCPMHPEVKSPHPGTCPKCGMKLEPAARKDEK